MDSIQEYTRHITARKAARFANLVIIATVLALVLLLNACATPTQNARSLLDRLEFDADEYGTFELEGTVDLNPIPLFTTNVHMKLSKVKDKPTQTDQVAP